MNTEYEATFYDVDIDAMRQKLKALGARQEKERFMQKRTVFNLPNGYDDYRWLRVRDEGDRITMSLKQVGTNKIESQKELELIISDYKTAVELLIELGCKEKAYQETYREIWKYKNVEICLDEWPWLKPLIEIEGENDKDVREVCKKMGFNYQEAIFDSADAIFSKVYNVSRKEINDNTPRVTFDTPNPFENK